MFLTRIGLSHVTRDFHVEGSRPLLARSRHIRCFHSDCTHRWRTTPERERTLRKFQSDLLPSQGEQKNWKNRRKGIQQEKQIHQIEKTVALLLVTCGFVLSRGRHFLSNHVNINISGCSHRWWMGLHITWSSGNDWLFLKRVMLSLITFKMISYKKTIKWWHISSSGSSNGSGSRNRGEQWHLLRFKYTCQIAKIRKLLWEHNRNRSDLDHVTHFHSARVTETTPWSRSCFRLDIPQDRPDCGNGTVHEGCGDVSPFPRVPAGRVGHGQLADCRVDECEEAEGGTRR